MIALGVFLLPRAGFALPDLSPEIYDVTFETGVTVAAGDVAEGCAAATDGRTLVRFGVRSHNVGADALEVGDPGCPDCLTNPGVICANPLFECSPAQGHNHPHFLDFGRYELFDVAGNQIAVGGKRSFCLLDTACPGGGAPVYTSCTFQGISPGCYDEYRPALGCQYIDVTGVPGIGTHAFKLRVTLDPDQLLADADRTNNVAEVALFGCGDGLLQAGEDCDPGPAGAPCCDADCHFQPAGAVCGASSSSCRGPGLCDGVSAECAGGAPFADGVACGAGTPPCVNQVCRSGSCVAEKGDGCLIDDACHAPGPDPANACQECDPSRRSDGWSPIEDATPVGFRCQMARVAAAMKTLSCPEALTQKLSVRIGHMDGIAFRLGTASPRRARRLEARLARRAGALERMLDAAGRRGTCATGTLVAELQRLRDELVQLRGTPAP